MSITCSSQPLAKIITKVGGSVQHILLADHDHGNPAIYQAVTDSITVLSQLGVKHLFLEVPSLLNHLLDPGKRPLRDNPQAAEALKPWSIRSAELIPLIDEAHRNGMTVHFADDHVNTLRASRVLDEMNNVSKFKQYNQLHNEFSSIRSRIDPLVAAQIDAVKEKTATLYGSLHFDKQSDINEMISGGSATIGLHTNTVSRVLENIGALLFRNDVSAVGENACVYARPAAKGSPAESTVQR